MVRFFMNGCQGVSCMFFFEQIKYLMSNVHKSQSELIPYHD
jgi:hypothetical protein